MARFTTLAPLFQPLMGKPSIELPYCAICGRTSPLNQHHIVRRGSGRMWDEQDRELQKPTITLCGFGNTLKGPNGIDYCHGLAHANRLHFKWVGNDYDGHWEYILLDIPLPYQIALKMDDWRPVNGFDL